MNASQTVAPKENVRDTRGALPEHSLRLICATAVFIPSFVLYYFTLAPTVTLVDSGELILVARTLGVAHPPGFPFYVILAHLATLIPIGNIAQRVGMASGMFGALAAAIVALAAFEAILSLGLGARSKSPRKERSKRKKNVGRRELENDSSVQSMKEATVAAIAAGLTFAFGRTLWAYATIAEVYTLNVLLIALVLLLMLRWRRGKLAPPRHIDPALFPSLQIGKSNPRNATLRWPSDRLLYAAALAFGLGLGVHHVTVGLMLPALAVLVYSTEGRRFFLSKRLVYAALIAAAGAGVYVYLPIAASRFPLINWGDPSTFERFIWHITGKQYTAFFTFSTEVVGRQLALFVSLAIREFGRPWLPVGLGVSLLGFAIAFRRNRILFWFLILVVGADLAYGLGYEIAEDKDAYYLPAFLALSISLGIGTHQLIHSMRLVKALSSIWVRAVAVSLVPAIALAGDFGYNNRSQYFIAKDYVTNIVSTIEPGGMLLTQDWQVYSPMLYLQEVENLRRDVVVIDVNQLRRSPWYFDYLRQAYPQVMNANTEPINAFLEDLKHWQREPDAFSRNPSLLQNISTHFFGMLSSLVETHFKSAPVYVTIDVAADRAGENAEFTKYLTSNYQLVPTGLVFQTVREREFRDPPDLNLITRGLSDGSLKFEDDDTVKLKVLPAYVGMLVNRGRYLAAHGKKEQAFDSYRQAVALDPASGFARQALAEAGRSFSQQ